MKRLVLLFVVCLIAIAGAQANPMVGTWRASNGTKVQIPAGGGNFQLIWLLADGRRITHPAHWTRPGQEFTWTDKQGAAHKATLDPDYKIPRIKDVGEAYPDSPAYWYPVDK